jgi:restriction system protein
MQSRKYYRIILGSKHAYAEDCYQRNCFAGNWGFTQTLENDLTETGQEFRSQQIPIYLKNNPGASKVAAGLACGMLWRIAKGIRIDDMVLCPDGKGNYWVGRVISNYAFDANHPLPHQRGVEWHPQTISRADMSEELRNSSSSIGTVSEITKHADEIEKLLTGSLAPQIIATNSDIEDPSVFALEKHLQAFLVSNWDKTLLAKEYKIVQEGGENIGVEYDTDNGRIDILAIRKDGTELLVIELKRGRASDRVVGQILNYMGYISSQVAEEKQSVRGCIIALEDDQKIKNAIAMVPSVDFYRYEMDFKLLKIS